MATEIDVDELKVVHGRRELAALKQLHSDGAIGVMFYEHDGYRISRALQPSGEQLEFEWHVAVSRDHEPVAVDVAEQYAKAVVPAVTDWKQYDHGPRASATHLFASHV